MLQLALGLLAAVLVSFVLWRLWFATIGTLTGRKRQPPHDADEPPPGEN